MAREKQPFRLFQEALFLSDIVWVSILFCSYGIECVANPVDCDHNKSYLYHNIPGKNGLSLLQK
ncbi:hypothetical protein HMPREF1612_01408 [Escherichia coli 908585]|nr:hypothetical protein HMPREF9552_03988 [Escherichia coli MS 198-1]ESD27682.1 hypothetical protein HMPREF1600_02053 [Escherichia coli 907715]ESD54727.1 hypothetical protein HMPREF1605_02275 [Escherichia coli 908521]ESD92974.1 hypothetical protein HMPREF1612_01408 [Escherichia coli 908585]